MRRDPPTRISLIGNPASGRGRGRVLIGEAQAILTRAGLKVDVYQTVSSRDAVGLAGKAIELGTDLVVVIGGDGTIRDVVDGMRSAGSELGIDSLPPLGIIPGGTGNDLARTLGLSGKSIRQSIDIAINGVDQLIDVWFWNGCPFINVAGMGLDAAVGNEVNSRLHFLRGPIAYAVGLVTVLSRFAPFDLEVTWPDGEWKGKAWLVAFGNGKCYGGGMRIAPLAEPQDRLLDVVIVGAVGKLELLKRLPDLYFGRHLTHPAVTYFRTPRASVAAMPQPVTLDGELLATTPAEITLGDSPVVIRVPGQLSRV